MNTFVLNRTDDAAFSRIDELLHMLEPAAPHLDRERLRELIESGRMSLYIAESQEHVIMGMLTLTFCPTLSRDKYWIEDVIVDDAFRGLGVGRALVNAAVEDFRKKEGSPALYLTSNPSRTAARNLYRSAGFEEYETGVFRIIDK